GRKGGEGVVKAQVWGPPQLLQRPESALARRRARSCPRAHPRRRQLRQARRAVVSGVEPPWTRTADRGWRSRGVGIPCHSQVSGGPPRSRRLVVRRPGRPRGGGGVGGLVAGEAPARFPDGDLLGLLSHAGIAARLARDPQESGTLRRAFSAAGRGSGNAAVPRRRQVLVGGHSRRHLAL